MRNLMTKYPQRNLVPIFFLVVTIWGLSVLLPSGAAGQDSAALERQVFALVNAHRASLGLTPLIYREDIAVVGSCPQESRSDSSPRTSGSTTKLQLWLHGRLWQTGSKVAVTGGTSRDGST